MANEVQVSAGLSVSKSGISLGVSGAKSITQAGNANTGTVQNIGTSAEALSVGDVSTIGYLLIKNQDATNFVEVDSANTFDAFPQKLLPGEFVLLKPQTATIYLKADTDPVDVYFVAVEL